MQVHWGKKRRKTQHKYFLSKTILGFFITQGAIVYCLIKMVLNVNNHLS